MSTEYNFYVGLRDKDTGIIEMFPGSSYEEELVAYNPDSNKFEPAGKKKRPCSILWRSRSYFDEELLLEFNSVNENKLTDDLREAFTYEDYRDKQPKFDTTVSVISADTFMKLNDNFVKSGYFLIEDVNLYQNAEDKYDLDIFYDKLSSEAYSGLVANDVQTHFEDDGYGEHLLVHGWKDYMYFAYPDYNCKEYLIHELKVLLTSYDDIMFTMLGRKHNKELVLINSWG